jgi:hypothetical protein
VWSCFAPKEDRLFAVVKQKGRHRKDGGQFDFKRFRRTDQWMFFQI